MSGLFLPPPGWLFSSLLFNKTKIRPDEVTSLWENKYGSGEVYLPKFNPMKDYYSKEMGSVSELERLVILSPNLVEREELVEAKIWSAHKENELMENGKRVINIDPGLMTLENIILGTGKIYGHRPYLGRGVYADLNLLYVSGSYSALDWTYPDYRQEDMISFFNHSRIKLHSALKESGLDSYNARR